VLSELLIYVEKYRYDGSLCFGSRGSQVQILVSRLDYQAVMIKFIAAFLFGVNKRANIS
jgi:hypothetical protein